MIVKAMLLGVTMALTASAAVAQGINALGTIEQIDATTLTLKEDDGAVARFALAPDLLVVQAKPATLADIRPDDFVASAAVHGRDGKLHSTELRIFPAAMRGLGEGQRPMNDDRGQTMTNAVVTGTAVADGSNDLKVKFAGGESELVVDPGIPVTRLDVVDRSLAQAGLKARVQGTAGQVGRITLP